MLPSFRLRREDCGPLGAGGGGQGSLRPARSFSLGPESRKGQGQVGVPQSGTQVLRCQPTAVPRRRFTGFPLPGGD